jgi:hypothetical protein
VAAGLRRRGVHLRRRRVLRVDRGVPLGHGHRPDPRPRRPGYWIISTSGLPTPFGSA